MTEEHTVLEIIAPTIDEAIDKGLSDLGLSREQVDIEVLDSGSKGLFGLGGRQARIRLRVRGSDEPANVAAKPAPAHVEKAEKSPAAPARKPAVSSSSVVDDDLVLQVARDIVNDLVEKMKVPAKVTSRYIEAVDENDERSVLVEIHGEDLSILIGRRSETLNALQYIAGLIISKEVGRWVPFTIDVQGYRSRRERQLKQLALRMAEQAVATGHRQVLEPMPASERRIIHLALRDNDQVVTESVGEEPNRKVTIVLKK